MNPLLGQAMRAIVGITRTLHTGEWGRLPGQLLNLDPEG